MIDVFICIFFLLLLPMFVKVVIVTANTAIDHWSKRLVTGLANTLYAQVIWGKISMVDAERRLLANALQDPDNQHFVLLSDRWL